MYKLSDYIVVSDPVNKEADPHRMLLATRSGKYLLIKESIYKKLLNKQFSEIRHETLIRLVDIEAVVPDGEDEFHEVLSQNIHATQDSNALAITIQPTANCQLGCNYCGQQHSKKNVDHTLSKKITDRIINKLDGGRFKRLDLSWFGGEPLMAYSEILRMSEVLRDFCKQKGVVYTASMITNGMSFKPNVVANLLEQEVNHFQITLDGGPETHDVMRITKEGKKTFAIILGNIVDVANSEAYIKSGAHIVIRMNVNQVTAKGINKLIDLLAKHDLHKRNVSLNFAPVFDWGGNNAHEEGLQRAEFASAEIDWMLYAMKKGFKYTNVLPGRASMPCMVVRPDAEVYDAYGNIFPCYEFPYTPAFEGAEYKIGHIDDDPATNNLNAVTKNWFADVKTDVAPCKTCNLFPVCGGACPKQWLSGNVACPSFKVNIKDRLVLQYLIGKNPKLGASLQKEETV